MLTNSQFHYCGKQISDSHLLRPYYFILINPFEIKIMIKARKLRWELLNSWSYNSVVCCLVCCCVYWYCRKTLYYNAELLQNVGIACYMNGEFTEASSIYSLVISKQVFSILCISLKILNIFTVETQIYSPVDRIFFHQINYSIKSCGIK